MRMIILKILTFSFCFLLSYFSYGEATLLEGLKLLETNNFLGLDHPCGDEAYYGAGESCSKTKHCGDSGESFCFDGVEVIDEGKQANLNMMYYFCTDLEFPKETPPLGIGFGPCSFDNKLPIGEREIRVEDKIVCVCQDKKWQCFSK